MEEDAPRQKRKREYSTEFRAAKGKKGKAIHIDGIPDMLYRRVQAKLKREKRSLRALVLGYLKEWVNEGTEEEGIRAAVDFGQTGGDDDGLLGGDGLPVGEAAEAESGEDYREPGSPLPAAMDRRLDAQEPDDRPDSRVGDR